MRNLPCNNIACCFYHGGHGPPPHIRARLENAVRNRRLQNSEYLNYYQASGGYSSEGDRAPGPRSNQHRRQARQNNNINRTFSQAPQGLQSNMGNVVSNQQGGPQHSGQDGEHHPGQRQESDVGHSNHVSAEQEGDPLVGTVRESPRTESENQAFLEKIEEIIGKKMTEVMEKKLEQIMEKRIEEFLKQTRQSVGMKTRPRFY